VGRLARRIVGEAEQVILGDLAGAEELLRKAVAAAPTKPYFRRVLDDIVRKRTP
jgi:hypothetical protein